MDAADAKMAKLMDRRDNASASTTTCRKELLQVLTNLATVFKMVKNSLTRAVAMAKERDAVTSKS